MADERERQGRAQQEQAQRRRRSDGELQATQRLPIPPEVAARLERDGLQPRWVNDQSNRMHRFTVQDDYDKVEGVEPVPVGTDEAGKPIMAHLLAKRKDFIAEDQAKAEEKRKTVEDALFRSPDAAAAAAGNPSQAPKQGTYIDKASKIGRGNQILEGG